MTAFTSLLGPTIESFLIHKRAIGHGYHREEAHLRVLDRLAATTNDSAITEALVRSYVSAASRRSRLHRLTVIRQLARFVAHETPGVFVPPRRFLGVRRSDAPIRILSREEYGRFLAACDQLRGSRRWTDRGFIHGVVLRTLLLTGLRRGEALRLKCRDVDLGLGIITIVDSKFGKSRFVPLAPDLVDRLRVYDRVIVARTGPREGSHAFFPGPDGRRAGSSRSLYESFRRALTVAGIAHHGRSRGPRCHDLRHGFAVLRLLSWYEQGDDLAVKLPLLATYIGHTGIESLQVYLHMTRDLVGEVVRRQQGRFGDLITAEVAS